MNSKILRVLLIVAAVLAPGFAFAGEKDVVLDVDGQRQQVKTFASSSAELLERVGLNESHDAIGDDSELAEGDIIVVRRHKNIRLLTPKGDRQVIAHGLTISEALKNLGIPATDADLVIPPASSPLIDGMTLLVREAIAVKVKVDNKTEDVLSSAPTVRMLLSDAEIKLGSSDYTVPSLDSIPQEGAVIRVVRAGTRAETKRVEIAFGTETKSDAKLDRGTRQVVREGREGLRELRYRITVENGKVTGRKLVSSKVVREPVDKVVKVGTRPPPPKFVSRGNSETGVASWYRHDALIAAHKTLPFGTVVRVTNLQNGKTLTVTIRDRGPYIEGRIIDLSSAAFERLAPIGSGTFKARIDW